MDPPSAVAPRIGNSPRRGLRSIQNKCCPPPSHEAVWKQTLKEFGDVREVASQLRNEHWPQYVGWRLIAILAALVAVFSISHPLALLDPTAISITVLPAIAFMLFDTFSGSTRWNTANRIGTWGCIVGAVAGLVYMLTNFGSPPHFGAGMAVSILSGLYCVTFYTPSRTAIISFVGISLLDVLVMLLTFHALSSANSNPISMDSYWPQYWSFERAFFMQALALFGAGITLGVARFGIQHVAHHDLAIGAGIYLINLVVMLAAMSDPSKVIGHMVVALDFMCIGVAICHLVSNSPRLLQRLLR